MSERESWEVRDAALRMMKALVRRSGEGDENALADLALIVDRSPVLLSDAVAAYRAWKPPHAPTASWTEVGRILGITRQGAQQRFSRHTVTPDEQTRREAVVGRLEL